MALVILNRPEKTLENGYVSKWNASATPLIYKFQSDLFPTNNFDAENSIESLVYSVQDRGTILTTDASDKYVSGDWVSISGSPVDGVYKVRKKLSEYTLLLDLYITENYDDVTYPNMKDNIYYKGYKALVKVYCGAPEYHPYNQDQSKPQREIGTIEVQFDENNEGVCNVRAFIKPDMAAKLSDTLENNPDAWTSFAIEYAETWDSKTTPLVYQEDILDNCFAFAGFSNSNFTGGLLDWLQEELVVGDLDWISPVTGQVAVSGSGTNRNSKILNQAVGAKNGIPYTFNVDYDLLSGTVSDNLRFNIYAQRESDDVWENIYLEQQMQLGADTRVINFTPSKDYKALGIRFGVGRFEASTAFEFRLNSFQVSTTVANQCKYSSFALLGAKQFGDSLGGNFGDYIADYQLQGKFLTHFEELKYPFYVNTLIPKGTFDRSENSDSVFLDTKLYDEFGNLVEYVRQPVANYSDGIYTIEPVITSEKCAWKNGVTQLVAIPSNLLLDGDNGTFDDATPANWNISIVDSIATGMTSQNTPEQGNFGVYNVSFPSLTAGEKVIYQYDTPIQTEIGGTYVVDAQGLIMNNFSSGLENNAYFYYRIKGTNFISNKFFLSSDRLDTADFTFEFQATSDSHQIEVVLEVLNDSGFGGGASLGVDSVTFKGAIVYLTETKPLVSSCLTSACQDTYEFYMRWLNDLGGWEMWNFTQKKTFGTTISNKIEMKRDITQDWDNTFINGDTQYDTLRLMPRDTIVVRSQNLTKDQAENVSKIKTSIKPQAYIDGRWVTVTVDNSSYVVMEEDGKVREMSFTITLPETIIQEQ